MVKVHTFVRATPSIGATLYSIFFYSWDESLFMYVHMIDVLICGTYTIDRQYSCLMMRLLLTIPSREKSLTPYK